MRGVSRTAISVPRDLMNQLSDLLSRTGVRSRSKAISEAISLYIAERYWILSDVDKEVTGAILLVYDHHRGRDVVEVQHKYLDLIRSTSHVHVDEERCLEVVIILGSLSRVRQLFMELQGLGVVEIIKPFLVPLA
ncbi:MAG: nickel-responsive transcriptional regulator NikR [Candidatus Korarchaeota archaeon NZ13-K]|nr:MAG: nickel-responsive transcriptional regulator NikR [Candidatus Korarchaeota archaeon NZ13-K]